MRRESSNNNSWRRLPESSSVVMARFSARLEASRVPFGQARRRRRRRHRSFALLSVFAALLSSRLGAVASDSECTFSTTLDELGAGSHEVSVTVSNTFAGVPPADDDCPQGGLVFFGRVVGDSLLDFKRGGWTMGHSIKV